MPETKRDFLSNAILTTKLNNKDKDMNEPSPILLTYVDKSELILKKHEEKEQTQTEKMAQKKNCFVSERIKKCSHIKQNKIVKASKKFLRDQIASLNHNCVNPKTQYQISFQKNKNITKRT